MGDLDPDTKSKLLSVLVAFIITVIFAVPYFYYQYFYTPSVTTVEESEPGLVAQISDAFSEIMEHAKNPLEGDVYQKN